MSIFNLHYNLLKNTILNTINLSNCSQLDIIGDIHGYCTALITLLDKMGYKEIEPYNYTHPEGRKVIFIGDYIDRGKEILKTLRIVRTMQENGNAFVVMGNHEYNFLCYNYINEKGESFRTLEKKTEGEKLTDLELGDEKWSFLNWMAELPLFFENEFCRCVHAHWDQNSIDIIRKRGIAKLDQQGLRQLHADTELLEAYEIVTKGAEINIPQGYHYTDKNGIFRKEARKMWWLTQPGNTMGTMYASLPDHLKDIPVEVDHDAFEIQYKHDEKPVFFGHYWMNEKDFDIIRENICCVDFSIAKDGVLAAYRFSGESDLKVQHLLHHMML